ncbi:hypothetical protein ACLB1R_19700 [Escherichia coli]
MVTATHKHIKTLFSSRYWRRTAFNSVFFVCLVIPWFVIYTWLPTIAPTYWSGRCADCQPDA